MPTPCSQCGVVQGMTLSQLDKRFRRSVATTLNGAVDAIAGGIETHVPRETGGLARTLAVEHAQPQGAEIAASVAIGSDEHPAGPDEFGTTHQLARPFFRPSVGDALPNLFDSLRHATR